MKISEAVAMLIEAAEVHGDVEVRVTDGDTGEDTVLSGYQFYTAYGKNYPDHVELT